ncbi:trypco2 family protein [Streptomyces sp. NPDC002587]
MPEWAVDQKSRSGAPLVKDAVELADMIAQLRQELSRAMSDGDASDLPFKAERVELELTVGVEGWAGWLRPASTTPCTGSASGAGPSWPGCRRSVTRRPCRTWFPARGPLVRAPARRVRGSSGCRSPTGWSCSRTGPRPARRSAGSSRIPPCAW